jgi:hypothetical protein
MFAAFVLGASPVSMWAATVPVDCGAGGKIQSALNAAIPGDTLLVTGVCQENVTVRDEASRIAINGQGSATIQAITSTAATVTVLGRNITIQGFTITGGRQGVSVLRGGSALIDSNLIEGSAGAGVIVLQNGHARIVNNRIQLNANAGILVQENSYARIGFLDLGGPALGNIIQNNAVAGILIQGTSGAWVVGNGIAENDGPGVSIRGASEASLAGNHINQNQSDAVTVTQNSFVQLGDEPGILNAPNETAGLNGGFGVRCLLNSSVDGELGTLTGATGATDFAKSCASGLGAHEK